MPALRNGGNGGDAGEVERGGRGRGDVVAGGAAGEGEGQGEERLEPSGEEGGRFAQGRRWGEGWREEIGGWRHGRIFDLGGCGGGGGQGQGGVGGEAGTALAGQLCG